MKWRESAPWPGAAGRHETLMVLSVQSPQGVLQAPVWPWSQAGPGEQAPSPLLPPLGPPPPPHAAVGAQGTQCLPGKVGGGGAAPMASRSRSWEAVHWAGSQSPVGAGGRRRATPCRCRGRSLGSAGHCGADAAPLGTHRRPPEVTSPRQPARTTVSPAVAPPAEKHPQDPSRSRPSQLGRGPQS